MYECVFICEYIALYVYTLRVCVCVCMVFVYYVCKTLCVCVCVCADMQIYINIMLLSLCYLTSTDEALSYLADQQQPDASPALRLTPCAGTVNGRLTL
jgi:hypothetical protein